MNPTNQQAFEAASVLLAFMTNLDKQPETDLLANYGELLTPDDIAGLTHMHPETVRTLIKQGDLVGCKIGQRYFVSKPNFLEYLNGGGLDAA